MAAVGIDVGSTTAKVVVVSAGGELEDFRVVRHGGSPLAAVRELIAQLPAAKGPRSITGSIGLGLAEQLAATPLHEVQALTLNVQALHAAVGSVVELGGQDAKIISFAAEGGGAELQMNDRCAAGTGATIDRVLRRLGLEGHALAELVLSGDVQVAAKCGVFAETDVVNLVQSGATNVEALSALARAIVLQNLAVLARGRVLRAPVLLLGGPHAHLPLLRQAWQEALAELWRKRGAASGSVEVPRFGELYVAWGAARHALAGGRALSVVAPPGASRRDDGPLLDPADPPEALDAVRCKPARGAATVSGGSNVGLAAVRGKPAREAAAVSGGLHLGLDAGSTTMKAVLLDGRGALLSSSYGPTTGQPVAAVQERLRELFAAWPMAASLPLRSLGVTGYGAALLGPLLQADAAPVETLAHARAVVAEVPAADVVVDVGGTDIKVLRLRNGSVAEFFVSNQCAAGHGAFLAATAAELGLTPQQYAEHAFAAGRAPRFSVGCAIFMDSDRVTFQRDGYSRDEILAGLAWATARNIWEFVVPDPPERLGRRFVLTGGTQRNLAAAYAQLRYLRARVPNAEVQVARHPELCGAIGAALFARDAVAQSRQPSRALSMGALQQLRVQTQTSEALRCTRCELGCARARVEVQGARTASWIIGNGCERGADLGSTGKRGRAHAVDLFAADALIPFRWPASTSTRARETQRSWPVLGVPRVMGMYRAAPLLLGYLEAAGMPRENVIWSPPTSPALFAGSARRGANDPCFPAKLVHAHVDYLLQLASERPLDGLLLPTITHAAVAPFGMRDCASCPIVAACGHTTLAALSCERNPLPQLGIDALLGELCLADPVRLEAQLFELLGSWLALSPERHQAAFAAGLARQRSGIEQRRRRGARVLGELVARGRVAAVILARPYHCDPGVQHGISTHLSAAGLAVLGVGSLGLEPAQLRDLSSLLPELTNSGSAEKLWAARVVASHPNLVAVDLSSFRCGQDASVLPELVAVLSGADKPSLWLHDLDEDTPALSLRLRIDTFVAAVRSYERRWSRTGEARPC